MSRDGECGCVMFGEGADEHRGAAVKNDPDLCLIFHPPSETNHSSLSRSLPPLLCSSLAPDFFSFCGECCCLTDFSTPLHIYSAQWILIRKLVVVMFGCFPSALIQSFITFNNYKSLLSFTVTALALSPVGLLYDACWFHSHCAVIVFGSSRRLVSVENLLHHLTYNRQGEKRFWLLEPQLVEVF